MSTVKRAVLVNIAAIFLAGTVTGCGFITDLLKGGSVPTPKPAVSTDPSPIDSEPQRSSEPQSKLDVLRKMNCQDPTEADYILNGNYQVGWTAGGDRYEGVLKMEKDTGVMRLKYFNQATNTEDVVDQTMVLAVCPKGLLLVGVNPTPADSQEPHPTYAPDNILMRRETNGNVTLSLVDDNGVTAPVEISEITN
jgi:hypothetical protein